MHTNQAKTGAEGAAHDLKPVWLLLTFLFTASVVAQGAPPGNASSAGQAVREAMQRDPSFCDTAGAAAPRDRAVAAWRTVLARDDLAPGQQVFAWWRIGCLYAYNMDVAAGEYPDYPQAASAFQRALEVDPRLVSTETVNAVSILATMPARPHQKARNLASAYTWLRSRSDEDLRYSSARVTAEGYAVGPDGSEPGAARSAGAAAGDNNAQARGERVNPQLANWLVAGTDAVERNMEQLIRDPRDAPEAASVLLQLVDDAAPPQRLAEWQRLAALSERTGGTVERLLYDRVMNIEQTLETEWKPVEPPAAVATDAPQPTHPGGVSPATHETPRESASLAGAIIRWWWIPALLAILAAAIGGAWLLLSMRRA